MSIELSFFLNTDLFPVYLKQVGFIHVYLKLAGSRHLVSIC